MVERDLIDAFKTHGRLLGHKVLRSSLCAFIDFERVEDAAAARAALHEAKFSNCEIRVEYKVATLPPPPPTSRGLLLQTFFVFIARMLMADMEGLALSFGGSEVASDSTALPGSCHLNEGVHRGLAVCCIRLN